MENENQRMFFSQILLFGLRKMNKFNEIKTDFQIFGIIRDPVGYWRAKILVGVLVNLW